MLTCIQNLVKFCPFLLKILSGNKIFRSIKGRNSVANLRNLTLYNPNLDLINVNVYTKSGSILSIGSQDIERKQKIMTELQNYRIAELQNNRRTDRANPV